MGNARAGTGGMTGRVGVEGLEISGFGMGVLKLVEMGKDLAE